MAWHGIAQQSRAEQRGPGDRGQAFKTLKYIGKQTFLGIYRYIPNRSLVWVFFILNKKRKKWVRELTCSDFYTKIKSFSSLLLFLYTLGRHENHQNKINAFKRWAKGQGKGNAELLLFLIFFPFLSSKKFPPFSSL